MKNISVPTKIFCTERINPDGESVCVDLAAHDVDLVPDLLGLELGDEHGLVLVLPLLGDDVEAGEGFPQPEVHDPVGGEVSLGHGVVGALPGLPLAPLPDIVHAAHPHHLQHHHMKYMVSRLSGISTWR